MARKKDEPLHMTGIRKPEPMPEADLRVSLTEMLATHCAVDGHEATSGKDEAQHHIEAGPDRAVIDDIDVAMIKVSPYQPRITFDEVAIEDLANSIQSLGLIKPILVRPLKDGWFELIGGERRWRAHKLAGIKVIQSMIREVDDDTARILAITDNEGQEQLTEYERGKSYAHILESRAEPSLRSLARRLGVNVSIVSRCLLLLQLPASVLDILDVTPGLIGGKTAKIFIDYAKDHSHLVLNAVVAMRDSLITQEQALRMIAKEIEQKEASAKTQVQDRTLAGVGKLRLRGKRMEILCEKGVSVERLTEQFEEFLKHVDRALITSE
ncbi:ParB/RepB/Spo0J family partition protein [Pseudomonas sp. 2FE]|uniref:ParB/RepB/Spo0J family partition protein n=1 Tax=Pseudomonas sp. 2FE TaxID=2502190 RepID=UPI0014854FE5|nr:ParB/RepB/Spo0J family partition protein [Pseudomonas sp. 2FE]